MKKLLKNILDAGISFLLIIAIAFVSFGVGKIYYEPTVPYQTVMSAIDSSVHYRAEFKKDELNYYATCTGVVLENRKDFSIVATAKHCIADNSTVYIENVIAKKVIKHKTRDLALVILDKKIPYKTVAKQPIKKHLLFEEIFHIGFPSKTLYSQGTTLIQTFSKDAGMLNVIKGCSGGGVFNKSGELIGIAVITSPPFGIYESSRGLINFLAEQDIDSIYKEVTNQEN